VAGRTRAIAAFRRSLDALDIQEKLIFISAEVHLAAFVGLIYFGYPVRVNYIGIFVP